MSEQKQSSCCSKQPLAQSQPDTSIASLNVVRTDPICGMQVQDSTAHYVDVQHEHTRYLFCCAGCKAKFLNQLETKSIVQKPSVTACCGSSMKTQRDTSETEHSHRFTDPVCGMTVSDLSKPHCEYQGQRYYFCCQGCLNKFQTAPEQYLQKQPAQTATPSNSCCATQSAVQVSQSQTSSCGKESVEPQPMSAKQMLDPVCGMTVTDLSKPHYEYQGHTYYFCCQGCLNKFQAQPEQYVKQQSSNSESQMRKENACCSSDTVTQAAELKTASCCGGQHKHVHTRDNTAIDPVCGMSVDTTTDLKTDYQNQTYYFCNPSCLSKFKQDPAPYLIPFDQRKQPEGMDDVMFTCPMDPEIQQKGPGTCPICGMALEPMQPTLDEGPNPELVDFRHRFWMTLPLTLLVFVLAMGSHIHGFIPQHIQPWIELVLSLPVVLWAGKPFIERCWVSYKTRHLNMWSLIGVGILAAFIYSIIATIFPALIPMEAKTGHGVAVYFEAACMIVSLSLLGQIMELKARAKTADALKSLLKLQSNTAKRIEQGHTVEVDIAEIQLGDVLHIASGEQIPLDGVVIDGTSHVDESMMTGEPLAVKKQRNDHVIGGTVNQQGSLKIKTTAVGQNTVLAKMIQTVADAQRSKAPLQRLADVVAKYFVMIVLSISVLTFVVWMVVGGAHFDLALMCAVAVLIIACPCALGLATPMSVMATTGRAAQKGVLFKDAESIEALSQVDTILLDKTGTLTEGQPSVKDIRLFTEHYSQAQIETWIASVEQHSSHPIAKTLVQRVPQDQIIESTAFEELLGFGVKAKIKEQWFYVGSQSLLEQLGLTLDSTVMAQLDQARSQGHVVSFLATDHDILASIVIYDAIKPNAKNVIDQLHGQGIRVVMATGDHIQNAQWVADALGIRHVHGNCTPSAKLELVKALQAQGRTVAMAGDGINDAPALAQAHVGIAMGNGTDIAKQTAQITLVKGDVRGIAEALNMAQTGVRNMKQNLAFSLIYNGLGVPVAAGIFYPLTGWLLTPMLAAVAMSLSSLSVVLNALRLNKS